MPLIQHESNWLIKLLEQNRSIFMKDELGTFVQKTSRGWTVRGRDDVIALLQTTTFDDLSITLSVAKSLKNRFAKQNRGK